MDKLIHSEPMELRARKSENDEWTLEVLGAPYGGPHGGKDLQGEYFSPRTDFMMDIGDSRPAIYFHGDKEPIPEAIGTATVTRKDKEGLWFDVTLDKTKKYAKELWKSVLKGVARASSGTVNYLTRKEEDGEILTWPIGELTLLDTVHGRPINDLATVSMKAVYKAANLDLPEAFIKSEELKMGAVQEENSGIEIEEALVVASATLLGLLTLEESNGKRN